MRDDPVLDHPQEDKDALVKDGPNLSHVPEVLGDACHSFECDLSDSYGRPRKFQKCLGEVGAGNFSGTYRDVQNKERPCYTFPKREACLMSISYRVRSNLGIPLDHWMANLDAYAFLGAGDEVTFEV